MGLYDLGRLRLPDHRLSHVGQNVYLCMALYGPSGRSCPARLRRDHCFTIVPREQSIPTNCPRGGSAPVAVSSQASRNRRRAANGLTLCVSCGAGRTCSGLICPSNRKGHTPAYEFARAAIKVNLGVYSNDSNIVSSSPRTWDHLKVTRYACTRYQIPERPRCFFNIQRPITDGYPVERLPTARQGFSSSTEAQLNYAVTGDLAGGGLSLSNGDSLFRREVLRTERNLFALFLQFTWKSVKVSRFQNAGSKHHSRHGEGSKSNSPNHATIFPGR